MRCRYHPETIGPAFIESNTCHGIRKHLFDKINCRQACLSFVICLSGRTNGFKEKLNITLMMPFSVLYYPKKTDNGRILKDHHVWIKLEYYNIGRDKTRRQGKENSCSTP